MRRAATKQGWAIITQAKGTTKGTSNNFGPKVAEYVYSPNGQLVETPSCSMK